MSDLEALLRGSTTSPRPLPSKSHLRQWLSLFGLLLCAAVILAIALWPTPVDRGLDDSIASLLGHLHARGLPQWVGYDQVESFANVLMFIPVGFFIALLLPVRAWWVAIVLGAAASSAIEITQYFMLPNRFATIADVIANTIGAIVGVGLALALRATIHRRDDKIIAYARATRSRGRSKS